MLVRRPYTMFLPRSSVASDAVRFRWYPIVTVVEDAAFPQTLVAVLTIGVLGHKNGKSKKKHNPNRKAASAFNSNAQGCVGNG